MTTLSIICLAVVSLACAVGVFHHRYDDTLGERVGMSCIGIWSIAALAAKLLDRHEPELLQVMLHVGLASFAAGMAWAKWRAVQRRHQPAPAEISA